MNYQEHGPSTKSSLSQPEVNSQPNFTSYTTSLHGGFKHTLIYGVDCITGEERRTCNFSLSFPKKHLLKQLTKLDLPRDVRE